MQEKQRCMIRFFSIFSAFLTSSAGSLLASKKSKNIYCGKNTAVIRWPPRWLTALQVVRTSFLGPRPHLPMSRRLVCYQQEQFNLPREFFVSDSSTCTVNNRKFKMRRRRESQISNSSDKAKEHLCTCITPFCTFLCRQLHDYQWKCLISCFFEGVLLNKQWQNSFSSWTWIWLIEIQLQKSLLAFDKVS